MRKKSRRGKAKGKKGATTTTTTTTTLTTTTGKEGGGGDLLVPPVTIRQSSISSSTTDGRTESKEYYSVMSKPTTTRTTTNKNTTTTTTNPYPTGLRATGTTAATAEQQQNSGSSNRIYGAVDGSETEGLSVQNVAKLTRSHLQQQLLLQQQQQQQEGGGGGIGIISLRSSSTAGGGSGNRRRSSISSCCSNDGGAGVGDGAGSDTTGENYDNSEEKNYESGGSSNSSSSSSNNEAPLHTGFMKTGPKSYRVGSTVVNLNNCSEDDVAAKFRDNDICLEVECGDNRGSMFMSKLYQGSKGKCVESDGQWYTPNEFQVMSGRGSAKDWKRSIRHQGRSLKLLLSKDVLDVHPTACRCDSCHQLQMLNGKSSSSGTTNNTADSTKGGSEGDTSGEDNNKRLFNGGATGLGKKRKKGRTSTNSSAIPTGGIATAPASKVAKISSSTTPTPTTATTTKLEPVGITIPAPDPTPEEVEDRMVDDIPNLDSPLFKDVPTKKESSSDSSSSSGSSSSDDSSSSDEDSEDEDKKDPPSPVKESSIPKNEEPGTAAMAAAVVDQQQQPPPVKARTPIKLTISNVGKPSAKVTSSSSRDLLDDDSNSSDSEWDEESSGSRQKKNGSTDAKNEQYPGTKETTASSSPPLRWKPVSLNNPTTTSGGGDLDDKLWGDSPTPTAMTTTDSNRAGSYYDNAQVKPDNVMGMGITDNMFNSENNNVVQGFPNHPTSIAAPPRNQNSKKELTTVGCDHAVEERSFDEDSLLKGEEDMSIDTGLKHMDEDFLLKDEEDNRGSAHSAMLECKSVPYNGESETTSEVDKIIVKTGDAISNSSSNKGFPDKMSLDLSLLTEGKDSKYCPDGFILAPTLSKSPEHLRSPLKFGPCYNGGNLSHGTTDSCDVQKEKATTNCEQKSPLSENCFNAITPPTTTPCENGNELMEKNYNDSTNMCFSSSSSDANQIIKDIPDKLQFATKEDKPSTKLDKTCGKEDGGAGKSESEMDLSTGISTDNVNHSTLPATDDLSASSTTTPTTMTNSCSTPITKPLDNPSVNQTTSSLSPSSSPLPPPPSEAATKALPAVSLPFIGSSPTPVDNEQPPSARFSSKDTSSSVDSTPLSIVTADASENLSSLPPRSSSSLSTLSPSSSATTTTITTGQTTSSTTPPLPPPLSSNSSPSTPDPSSSSLPSTTAITTTTVAPSSSSSTPPSSSSASKVAPGACTNGIPDKENPFITWTKYDDDNSGTVDSHLPPPSSLVQALARAPFPPIPIPGGGGSGGSGGGGSDGASVSQISPLLASSSGGVSQLSPLGMAGISPGPQLPSHLASPGGGGGGSSSSLSQRGVAMSPGQGSPGSSSSAANQSGHRPSSSSMTHDQQQAKPVQKSAKRTSRLSNIIDNLRSTKEKQVSTTQPASKEPTNQEQKRKSALDALFGISQSVASSASPTTPATLPKFSHTSSPVGSSIHPHPSHHHHLTAGKDLPLPPGSDKSLPETLGLPSHPISSDTRHAIRSSLDAARAQAVNESFDALKDDLDKGKRMLENLELMKNGSLDPSSSYGKPLLLPEHKPRRVDSSSSQSNRSRGSTSTPNAASSSSSSSSVPRPSSRQSSKLPSGGGSSSQSHSSSSSSLPQASKGSSGLSNSLAAASNSAAAMAAAGGGGGNMYQAAPSPALTAAHMELNAAAANIMAFQHMYGMQDPYLMKTLMSNPLYLQRMMEFQKQAMDPMMLRQLELIEAAAVADKTKSSKDQRAALNAQNMLWSAQAANMLQHQQMQQLQQIQLHHQQQQMQQHVVAAAAKEKESLDTIATLFASKSNNFHNSSSKSINTGSISTGQSSKFVAPSSPSPALSSNKRPRSNATPTLSSSNSSSYGKDLLSAEKKARLHSSQTNASSGGGGGYVNSSSALSSLPSSSSSSSRNSHSSSSSSNKPSSSSSSSSSRSSYPASKQDYQDLQAQLSASAAAGLWGFPPGMVPQQQMDMLRMSRYFEQQQHQLQQQHHQQQQQQHQQQQQQQHQQQRSSSDRDRPASSASSAPPPESEAAGVEVLDLSVKPRTGKA